MEQLVLAPSSTLPQLLAQSVFITITATTQVNYGKCFSQGYDNAEATLALDFEPRDCSCKEVLDEPEH